MKKITLLLLLSMISIVIIAQQKDNVWLEWGSNYDDFPFATGHSHAMLATDFDIGYTIQYLKAIEFNSWDMSGDEPVTVNWRIVHFDGEPQWNEQIGTLDGEFVADGNQVMDHVDIYNTTEISGHFAIALSFPDSTFHLFGMDEQGASGHTWFWKQDIQWVLLDDLIGIDGAWALRILIGDEVTGENDHWICNDKISIYPNPAENNVHIKNMGKNIIAYLFDLNGRQILKSDQEHINLSGIIPGIYQMVIKNENNLIIANQKLLIR